MGDIQIEVITEASGLDEHLDKSSRKWLGIGECLKGRFGGRNRDKK